MLCVFHFVFTVYSFFFCLESFLLDPPRLDCLYSLMYCQSALLVLVVTSPRLLLSPELACGCFLVSYGGLFLIWFSYLLYLVRYLSVALCMIVNWFGLKYCDTFYSVTVAFSDLIE